MSRCGRIGGMNIESCPMDKADAFFDLFNRKSKISAIADMVLSLLHQHKLTVAEVKAVLDKAREVSETIPFQWGIEANERKPQ